MTQQNFMLVTPDGAYWFQKRGFSRQYNGSWAKSYNNDSARVLVKTDGTIVQCGHPCFEADQDVKAIEEKLK